MEQENWLAVFLIVGYLLIGALISKLAGKFFPSYEDPSYEAVGRVVVITFFWIFLGPLCLLYRLGTTKKERKMMRDEQW